MKFNISYQYGVTDNVAIITAKIPMSEIVADQAVLAIMREICQEIAARYVAENYQEIIKLISPEAIATLSAAEAAAKIRESLEKNIPSKVIEVVKKQTEVYQRGILGGMKRLL